jgi:hypothetical protein
MGNGPGRQSAGIVLDHLLLGVPDLDQGIEWICEKTGAAPKRGGSHPGAGTRNALLSLGNRQYIEIISVDPEQTATSRTAELIRNLKAPQLIAWAASTTDISSLARAAEEAGYEFEGPIDGSRLTPQGDILRWKTLRIISDWHGVIPFFIEWDPHSVHPSVDSPAGCRLVSFEIRHPEPGRVREVLQSLRITATVQPGAKPQLLAVIDTVSARLALG